MKTAKIITAAAGAAMLLTACNVKDPIYDAPPHQGSTVTVAAGWNDTDGSITKPTECMLVVGSDEPESVPSAGYTFLDLLEPGDYIFKMYNEPLGIDFDGTVATVKTVTAPDGATGTFVESQPEWLFTGVLDATVGTEETYRFTMPMRQQVRQLTLVLTPESNPAYTIESITASLSGVAGSYHTGSDTYGSPSSVALEFTRQTSGQHSGKWTATVRLLGITGTQQKLTGTITFTGGNPAAVTLDSDLGITQGDFNGDKKTPLSLGGDVQWPAGAGFTATINGWNPINGGTGIAN